MAINPRPFPANSDDPRKPDNFYKDLFNHIYNLMRQLTLVGDERHPDLSHTPINHLILDSINLNQITQIKEGSIFLSEYTSVDRTEETRDKIIGEVVEDFGIRVEVFLGRSSSSLELTDKKTDLMMDMRHILTPENFVNLPLTGGARITDTRIASYGVHGETVNTGSEILVYIFEIKLHHFMKEL